MNRSSSVTNPDPSTFRIYTRESIVAVGDATATLFGDELYSLYYVAARPGVRIPYAEIANNYGWRTGEAEDALKNGVCPKLRELGIAAWLRLEETGCTWQPGAAVVAKESEAPVRQQPSNTSGPAVSGHTGRGETSFKRPLSKRRRAKANRKKRFAADPKNRWRLFTSPGDGTSRDPYR